MYEFYLNLNCRRDTSNSGGRIQSFWRAAICFLRISCMHCQYKKSASIPTKAGKTKTSIRSVRASVNAAGGVPLLLDLIFFFLGFLSLCNWRNRIACLDAPSISLSSRIYPCSMDELSVKVLLHMYQARSYGHNVSLIAHHPANTFVEFR